MDNMQRQNEELQRSIQGLLQEIEKQKEVNGQHENQIGTLLNFNERLLQIIEKQINNANKDNNSLQPISQRSERQSDLYIPTIHSMVRNRFASATKSETGYPTTHSLIDKRHIAATKLDSLKIEFNQSEVNYDNGDETEARIKQPIKPAAIKPLKSVEKGHDEREKVREEMNRELKGLKNFRDHSNKFYESKIKEVRALGTKIGQHGPMEQLSKISDKLNLSTSTQSMLKKVVARTNQ